MELPEESSETTKLVTAADGDNNWRKLSSNGENNTSLSCKYETKAKIKSSAERNLSRRGRNSLILVYIPFILL